MLDQLDCWHCVKLMLKVDVNFLKGRLDLMFLIVTSVLNLKLSGLKHVAATLTWLFAKFKVSAHIAQSSTYQVMLFRALTERLACMVVIC